MKITIEDSPNHSRKGNLALISTMLLFILVDAGWLGSLSRWGISYGGARLSLFLFGVVRVGICGFCWLAWRRFPRIHPKFGLAVHAACQLLVLVFGVYAFMIEPFRLAVNTNAIRAAGLTHPLRIVHLSDLHIEYMTTRERALIDQIDRLNPDLIVMTGDFISEGFTNDPRTFADFRQFVSLIHAPQGIYAVNGNTEYIFVLEKFLEGTEVRLLENQVVRFTDLGDRITLVGLNFRDEEKDGRQLAALMAQVKPEDYTILLYHKPDLAYAARDLGLDLYLCGHTHGGQVRLPFFGALFTNSRYGKLFEMGLYRLGDMRMYVNRGLGFTGGSAPRLRFLTSPEVAVFDLLPDPIR